MGCAIIIHVVFVAEDKCIISVPGCFICTIENLSEDKQKGNLISDPCYEAKTNNLYLCHPHRRHEENRHSAVAKFSI